MHLLPQLRLGGMENGVITLVNGMDAGRFQSSICSFEPPDEIQGRVKSSVPLHVLHRRSGNDPLLPLRLARVMRRQRPHVVHSHTWGTLCEGYAATRMAGVPLFIHGEHGTMELRSRNLRVQRWVWNRAARVLSVSQRLAERMSREVGFPLERIRVIHNGADLSRFGRAPRATVRRELGLADDAFVFGTVGRLVPVKDHAAFITAAGVLLKQGLQCRAFIVGDGPLHDTLERQIAECGLGSTVTLLGNRNDVERVLMALDLFVLSSKSEGLPNTVLEAMASGLPVISTAVGGADELVVPGVTGLLVPPGDPGALAAAISHLHAVPDRRACFGAKGRQRAQEKFDVTRMLSDYEQLYLELTEDARTGSHGPRACVESLEG